MTTHSSIVAWKISWTEEDSSVDYSPWGSQGWTWFSSWAHTHSFSSRAIHSVFEFCRWVPYTDGRQNDDVDPPDFNQLKLELSTFAPIQCSILLYPNPFLNMHVTRLKTSTILLFGETLFCEDIWCSLYLLKVIINPSISHCLAWLCFLIQQPPRGEPVLG